MGGDAADPHRCRTECFQIGDCLLLTPARLGETARQRMVSGTRLQAVAAGGTERRIAPIVAPFDRGDLRMGGDDGAKTRRHSPPRSARRGHVEGELLRAESGVPRRPGNRNACSDTRVADQPVARLLAPQPVGDRRGSPEAPMISPTTTSGRHRLDDRYKGAGRAAGSAEWSRRSVGRGHGWLDRKSWCETPGARASDIHDSELVRWRYPSPKLRAVGAQIDPLVFSS